MKFSASLALVALSTGAAAQGLQITNSIAASVINVLATAIPAQSVSSALANPSAFSAELASSLSAGKTPGWYASLPADVKSYLPLLYPAAASAVTTPAASSKPTGASSGSAAVVTASASHSSQGNTTIVTSVQSPKPSASKTGAASSSKSTGGAALPTGLVSAGVVGALGLMGMLAL